MIMEPFQNLDCAKGDVAPMRFVIIGRSLEVAYLVYIQPTYNRYLGMVWGFRFPEWSRRGFLLEVPCIFHRSPSCHV